MKSLVIFVIACTCLFHRVSTSSEENKDSVKLTIFYESYCPYSIEFIVNQLYKTWEEFKDYIKLELVPFGNAKQSYENGHFNFTCQHGTKECVGNILHACAIHQACHGKGTLGCPTTDELAKAMDYIHCVMQQPDQRAASDQCASEAGLKPNPINKCGNGRLGERLESAYGNQTAAFDNPKVKYVPFIVINNCASEAGLKPNPINKCGNGRLGERLESAYGNQTAAFDNPKVKYVPFIVINNKHTEKQQEKAEKDLRSVICKYITDQCK